MGNKKAEKTTQEIIHLGIAFSQQDQFKHSGASYISGVGFGYSCGYQDGQASKHRGDEGTLKLTKRDAENWLTDELEGEQSGTFSFYEVVELLHDYFVEANKAIANEVERLSSTTPRLSGDEKGMSGEQIWKLACNELLANIAWTFGNPDNIAKADNNYDKVVFEALGETIQNFPIPKYPYPESPTPSAQGQETETVDAIRVKAAKEQAHNKPLEQVQIDYYEDKIENLIKNDQERFKEVERLKGLIEKMYREKVSQMPRPHDYDPGEDIWKEFKSANNL